MPSIVTVTETVGVLFGIAGVWLTVRQSIWCWPVGIVSVSVFAVVFFHARLYGSAALQLAYVAVSLYGWYTWQHPGDGGHVLHVSRTPRRWMLALGLLASVGAAALGFALRDRTDAVLPFVDAAATSFSLAAQWMTTRKWIQTWLVWIVVDVVYVAMYLSQDLYQTAGLYGVFLVLAVLGYREWRRSMPNSRTARSYHA